MSFFTVLGVLVTSSCLTSSVRSAMASMSKSSEENKPDDEGEVIVIGGTEGYISMPETDKVPTSVSEYTVIAYDPDSTSLNSASSWEENQECPGGGHDCLYIERVENGRVTAITDKDGNDFLQKFVDDLYAGKLDKIDKMITEDYENMKKKRKLSEDNKLMAKVGDNWVKIDPGTKYEFDLEDGGKQEINMPISQYLVILMVLYKAEGKPKPTIKIDMPAVKRKVSAQMISAQTEAQLASARASQPKTNDPDKMAAKEAAGV
jgi:hypothetical protein